MSRGTRVSGDVYCVGDGPSHEDPPDRLPEEFFFPKKKGFNIGSGRVLFLNNRLLKFYGDIGYYRNLERDAQIASDNNSILQGKLAWLAAHNTNLAGVPTNQMMRKECCQEAIEMLVELRVLGAQIYVPYQLDEAMFVGERPHLAPFGSMSYLCSSPHYLSPELYSVPHGLPSVAKHLYRKQDRATLEGSNCYLAMKYGVMASHLNRIKLYRDHRIRSKLDLSCNIPGNKLEEKIRSCRGLLDDVVDELWKNIHLGHTDQLFYMPIPLHDKIMETNAIINVREMKDISCLYRQGGRPNRSLRYTYLLHESVLGYSLFRVYGAAGDAEPIPPSLGFGQRQVLCQACRSLSLHYTLSSA